MVLWGPASGPGVALGAFLANAWTGVPLGTVLGITTGNTLEAVVGALAAAPGAASGPSLDRVRDVLALVVLAAGISTVVSATIGVAQPARRRRDRMAAEFGAAWRIWWLGDMGGDLLVAPACWSRRRTGRSAVRPGTAAGGLALALASSLRRQLVFLPDDTNLAYLVFPLLVWAALRFWQPGAAAASLAVATIAVLFTANDSGPFVRAGPDDSLLLAQTFFGVAGSRCWCWQRSSPSAGAPRRSVEHIAQTLQESLLPSRLPEIPGIDAAARFRPAGERYRVGGDFYDVFAGRRRQLGGGRRRRVGKGPDAAAVTALARYTLREAASHEDAPESRAGRCSTSAILRQRAGASSAPSPTRGSISIDGSGARLTLAPGGHPLPLLLRARRRGSSRSAVPGTLLGVDAELQLADTTIDLDPGDALLFYTDGLTDAYAPERHVHGRRARDAARRVRRLDAAGIADRVITGVLDSSAAEPRDDIALVVLRIAPAARRGGRPAPVSG